MSRIASQIVRIPTLIILALVMLGPVSATARNPLVDSLDVIVGDTVTVNVETENSVFVSPLNPNVLLVSNNHWEGQPLGRDGVSAWISDDAGHTWTNGSWVGLGSGDPACAISKASEPDGRFLVGQMDGEPYAHIVYYKDSSGGSWNPSPILSTHGEMPCIWVDNFSAGPYANYTYCGWTDGDVVVAHSTDGEQWTPSPITVPNGKYRGISLNTDSLGSVYAVWGELDQSTNAGKRIRFAKSTNGGEIWSYPTTTIYTLSSGCPENDCITPQKSMKAVLKPSMTIDHSNDYIYVVWAEKNGDSGMDVFCIQSSNHGASWTSRQRVNQDEWHTGRDQWDPAITWDQCTEALVVTYLDSRDGNDNSHAHTYASVLMKLPAATWQDVRVSDSPWGADFGTTPGYEYIGVAAGDGRAYPVWSDDRSGAFRPYVSPFLLWGVQQQSVTASATKNSDSTLSVTASWATNLPASKNDQIILTSPDGVEYTSEPCSLCATNGGVSHDVTFDEVPCEPGMWTYTVRSERSGCSMGRTSDPKTFFVDPVVELAAHWPTVSGGSCPAGSPYCVTVDVAFQGDCVSEVDSLRLALQALPADPETRKIAFFPQAVRELGSSDAVAGNSYTATILEPQIGGCNPDSAFVYLDSVAVGKVAIPFAPSFDLNGTGGVDASDVVLLGETLAKCAGQPGYDPCADFVRSGVSEGCIDMSDYGAFAAHLGHLWSNPQKAGTGSSGLTTLRLEPGSPAGSLWVGVRLEGLRAPSALGLVLRPPAEDLQFEAWIPAPGSATRTAAVDTADTDGRRLVLLAFDVVPDASGAAELGKFVLRSENPSASLADLPVGFEDFAELGAGVESDGKTVQAASSFGSRLLLLQNDPNPFASGSTIRYRLGQASQVRLVIYDVAGRRVRALFEGRRPPGLHALPWDGRDDGGREVAPGIYMYQMTTEGRQETRKMVVVR